MKRDEIYDFMRALKLDGMSKALKQQELSTAFSEMSFAERLSHLLHSEQEHRTDKRRDGLIRRAKFKCSAHPRDIRYEEGRNLDRRKIAELLTCEWITRADNLLLSGSTGTGKTWIGCALGYAAANIGMSVRYVRTNVMLEEMRVAHLDASIGRIRKSFVTCNLLILDDFGIAPISEAAKEDLLELLEGRIDQGATMVIGQMDPTEWHSYLDSPHLADAIMDRLVQRAHKIALKGGSQRERY